MIGPPRRPGRAVPLVRGWGSNRSRSRADTSRCFPTRANSRTYSRIARETEALMSEYQYIGFRAIDGPVSEKNLEFMHKQSSRAEITPWTFENEYQYGDFRG